MGHFKTRLFLLSCFLFSSSLAVMFDPQTEKHLGNEAYKAKDFASALKHYNNAIKLDPTNIVYYTNKTAVLFEEGRYDECVLWCIKAVAVGKANDGEPKFMSKAMARLGNVYMKQKKYSLAVSELEESLTCYNWNEDSIKKQLIECRQMLDNMMEHDQVSIKDKL